MNISRTCHGRSNVLCYDCACHSPSSAAEALSSHTILGAPCCVQASRPAAFYSDVHHPSSNGHVESQALDSGSAFQSGDVAGDFDNSYEPILGEASRRHMLLAARFLWTECAGQDLSLMGASCVLWLWAVQGGPVGTKRLCRRSMSAEKRYIVCHTGQRSGPCGLSATASDKIPFTLSQLIVFRTVALTGNGSAAALALSVSKPAISKSLSVLEQVCTHLCSCPLLRPSYSACTAAPELLGRHTGSVVIPPSR